MKYTEPSQIIGFIIQAEEYQYEITIPTVAGSEYQLKSFNTDEYLRYRYDMEYFNRNVSDGVWKIINKNEPIYEIY